MITPHNGDQFCIITSQLNSSLAFLVVSKVVPTLTISFIFGGNAWLIISAQFANGNV
jgi:hypothetical protein